MIIIDHSCAKSKYFVLLSKKCSLQVLLYGQAALDVTNPEPIRYFLVQQPKVNVPSKSRGHYHYNIIRLIIIYNQSNKLIDSMGYIVNY